MRLPVAAKIAFVTAENIPAWKFLQLLPDACSARMAFDDRSLAHSNHRVVVEVALRDGAILERALR
jgi:hypothetical protein